MTADVIMPITARAYWALTLLGLTEEYRAARIAASEAAPYTSSNVPPKVCRYCGEHWVRWPNSKIDGHARCIVTKAFRERVRALTDPQPSLTYQMVAEALQVTQSVIRSWVHYARLDAGMGGLR